MTAEDTPNPSESPDSLDDFLNRTIEQFEELSTDFPELRLSLDQLRSLKAREDPAAPSPDAPTIDVKPGETDAGGPRAAATGESGTSAGDHIAVPAQEKKYGIREEVGRGGMGKIVKVWDQELNRFLAMKLILDGTAGDPERMSRFVQEAQVMGQIDHPGIVPIHDFGVDREGRVFFTMRLVKGQDFNEIIDLGIGEKDGWNMSRLVGALISSCQAVAFAHSRGIIHRDLKPANIMVGRFGEVYVMDWGLAKVKGRDDVVDLRLREDVQSSDLTIQTERRAEAGGSSDSPLVTMDGSIVGTPSYMAPEQAAGDLESTDQRSDVYSLGAILYVILTGQPPYLPPGAQISPRAIWARLIEDPPKPVHQVNPKAPPELMAVCEKAMAREPGDRYENSLDLAEDLQRFLDGRVVRAYRTGALTELGKWCKRNPVLTLTSAALVVLVCFSSVIFKLQYDELVSTHGIIAPLNDTVRHRDLVNEEERLWPAVPAMTEQMETWLGRAQALMKTLPGHTAELGRREDELKRVRTLYGNRTGNRREVDPEILQAEERRDVSRVLVENLGNFEKNVIARVEVRLSFAGTVREKSISGKGAVKSWADAIASIGDAGGRYAASGKGLELEPQLGLLPIGANPNTGLWEFLHLQTGDGIVPVRGEDGELLLGENTGLVFVLLPGGRFHMGSSSPGAGLRNPDPDGGMDERDEDSRPVKVDLAPFFISKYEMSQAQWARITGTNPSRYQFSPPGHREGRLPVEKVTWEDSHGVLDNLDLRLPTEAQWEYSCRAGTSTPWSTGGDSASLVGFANLADLSAKEFGVKWSSLGEWGAARDGHVIHAPVGPVAGKPYGFRPNAFGLYHLHGNVWERCVDQYYEKAYQFQLTTDGSGLRIIPSEAEANAINEWSMRGGGFKSPPSWLRSANRDRGEIDETDPEIGLRPVRLLTKG